MKKIIIFGLLLFLLAGCSTTKLVYDYGDKYLLWQLDSYFDLSNKQEEWLEEREDQEFAEVSRRVLLFFGERRCHALVLLHEGFEVFGVVAVRFLADAASMGAKPTAQ